MSSLLELEKKYELSLPSLYKNWHGQSGYNAENLIGSDMDFPHLSELQEWANEILKEDKSSFILPEKSFVFFMHQGYQFMYFICDGNNDPEIWYYFEGDMKPKIKWESFSEFVQKNT